jgi:hypothetical protein
MEILLSKCLGHPYVIRVAFVSAPTRRPSAIGADMSSAGATHGRA